MTETPTQTSRVALVTGASRGIGFEIAKQLHEAGNRVAITYNSTVPQEAESLGILATQMDINDPESVETAFAKVEEELGKVEILVANAGITRDMLMLRMSETDFTDVIDTNLSGAFRTCKRAVKSMMRARFGRIVLISSVVGLGGQAGQANYAASKAGLIGFGKSLAKEFASRGVTVNMVAPGPIETAMLGKLNEKQRAQMLDMVPLGRVGQPADVASAVTFLTSDQAGFITGVVLPVDGGLSMG